MSNSIWKTPDQKPEENKLIFAQHDRRRDGNIDYFIWDIHEFRDAIRKDSIRWCYLDELLAQADKVERLQKAVENYEKIIVGAMFAPDVGEVTAGMLEESHKTIKQLMKGE